MIFKIEIEIKLQKYHKIGLNAAVLVHEFVIEVQAPLMASSWSQV